MNIDDIKSGCGFVAIGQETRCDFTSFMLVTYFTCLILRRFCRIMVARHVICLLLHLFLLKSAKSQGVFGTQRGEGSINLMKVVNAIFMIFSVGSFLTNSSRLLSNESPWRCPE